MNKLRYTLPTLTRPFDPTKLRLYTDALLMQLHQELDARWTEIRAIVLRKRPHRTPEGVLVVPETGEVLDDARRLRGPARRVLALYRRDQATLYHNRAAVRRELERRRREAAAARAAEARRARDERAEKARAATTLPAPPEGASLDVIAAYVRYTTALEAYAAARQEKTDATLAYAAHVPERRVRLVQRHLARTAETPVELEEIRRRDVLRKLQHTSAPVYKVYAEVLRRAAYERARPQPDTLLLEQLAALADELRPRVPHARARATTTLRKDPEKQ